MFVKFLFGFEKDKWEYILEMWKSFSPDFLDTEKDEKMRKK